MGGADWALLETLSVFISQCYWIDAWFEIKQQQKSLEAEGDWLLVKSSFSFFGNVEYGVGQSSSYE